MDRLIRVVTAIAVAGVAAIAAVISYTHIRDLALGHGQPELAARLLPLSVDGLILAASLAMLREARKNRDAPRLARAMLWLGIVATVGANLAYGAGYGILGAVISAWPAVAFIGAAEMTIGLVRRAGQKADATGRQEDVKTVIARHVATRPDITNDELAALVGKSARTVRRYRASQNGAALA